MTVGVSKAYKMDKNVSQQSYNHCSCGHLTKNKPHDLRGLKFNPLGVASRGAAQGLWEQGLKFIKKRVGTHIHAKKKGEELSNVLVVTRRVAAKDRAPSSLWIIKLVQKKKVIRQLPNNKHDFIYRYRIIYNSHIITNYLLLRYNNHIVWYIYKIMLVIW